MNIVHQKSHQEMKYFGSISLYFWVGTLNKIHIIVGYGVPYRSVLSVELCRCCTQFSCNPLEGKNKRYGWNKEIESFEIENIRNSCIFNSKTQMNNKFYSKKAINGIFHEKMIVVSLQKLAHPIHNLIKSLWHSQNDGFLQLKPNKHS